MLLNDERLPVVIVCTQSEEEDPPNWKFQVTVEQGGLGCSAYQHIILNKGFCTAWIFANKKK